MSDNKNFYDVVIIGGGPAGLTAALYLARACYRVVVLEKEKFGGQITITSEVVNYPGVESTDGEKLTTSMRIQAESFGAEFIKAEATSLDVSGNIKKVVTNRGTLECFGILLATGAHPRMIGFQGESDFRGHGVAYCATCDGEFFTGKEVFVVGGGFAAAEESVFLTKYASHVTILMRSDDFSCAQATAEAAKTNENITIYPNTEVVSVEGDSLLRKLTYKNNKTGEVHTFEPENGDTFGVFVFAGYEPETTLVKDIVELNPQGYVVTDRQQKTSVDGVYAAGDVCIKNLRQVVTAVGDGALAATELERYASEKQKATGMVPERPVKRATAHKAADSAHDATVSATGGSNGGSVNSSTNTVSGNYSGASSTGGSVISDDMKPQLEAVFSRMTEPLILKVYKDNRPISDELAVYMNSLADMTDKLTVEIQAEGALAKEELPCVAICRKDGTESGLKFHGVPGGHEFTSFVLGLYNASGPGQPLDDDIQKRISELSAPVHMKIMVSLSCTMCPELVTSAQRIASLSDYVTAEIYDLNHFADLKEKYQVMSVPCMVINDGQPMFGKKDIVQLLDDIEKKSY